MNILGFHKRTNLTLIEKDGTYFVADRHNRKVLHRGTEEECEKIFIMTIAGFIENGLDN